MAMWKSNCDQKTKRFGLTKEFLQFRATPWSRRRDILLGLVYAGCPHLSIKIFGYLDSQSLLASSLVSLEWQQMLLETFYAAPKFRRRIKNQIFKVGKPNISSLTFSLDMARAGVVDVAVDDDLNLFVLAVLSGRPHVMSTSLFSPNQRRWVHRFVEHFPMGSLTKLSAGPSLIALGSKDGRIHVYEASQEFKCLRLIAVLAHHTSAIHNIIFSTSRIISCSDDMTIGVVNICSDGSLVLSKLLHGHVSRVRAIDIQGDRILSGSDDRSVKLWTLQPTSPGSAERPLVTLTGHSGPVVGVLLCMPFALSAAGCTVRLWDVLKCGGSGVCLKLLHHDVSPVTTMTWTSTFRGAVTIDAEGQMRCFDLDDLEENPQEILSPTVITAIIGSDHSDAKAESLNKTANTNAITKSITSYSPKQSLKFFASRDSHIMTSWVDKVVMKVESVPHHFLAFAISNERVPTVFVHCLDYVV